MNETSHAEMLARATVKARKAKGKARRKKVPGEEPYRSQAERRAEGKTTARRRAPRGA